MLFARPPGFTAAPPPSPPLPVPRNLPFHDAAAGIHNSILISESVVGISVACTRQNAGRSPKGDAGPAPRPRPPVCGGGGAAGAGPRPAGNWTKPPASTMFASVIVTFRRLIDERLSQVAAALGPAVV